MPPAPQGTQSRRTQGEDANGTPAADRRGPRQSARRAAGRPPLSALSCRPRRQSAPHGNINDSAQRGQPDQSARVTLYTTRREVTIRGNTDTGFPRRFPFTPCARGSPRVVPLWCCLRRSCHRPDVQGTLSAPWGRLDCRCYGTSSIASPTVAPVLFRCHCHDLGRAGLIWRHGPDYGHESTEAAPVHLPDGHHIAPGLVLLDDRGRVGSNVRLAPGTSGEGLLHAGPSRMGMLRRCPSQAASQPAFCA